MITVGVSSRVDGSCPRTRIDIDGVRAVRCENDAQCRADEDHYGTEPWSGPTVGLPRARPLFLDRRFMRCNVVACVVVTVATLLTIGGCGGKNSGANDPGFLICVGGGNGCPQAF